MRTARHGFGNERIAAQDVRLLNWAYSHAAGVMRIKLVEAVISMDL